jgi:hypothetical protein
MFGTSLAGLPPEVCQPRDQPQRTRAIWRRKQQKPPRTGRLRHAARSDANGIPVRHFPGKDKAERYATDPEYRASLVPRKAGEKAKK